MMNKDISICRNAENLELGIMELPTNCVVVISGGKAMIRELPEFGEYRIMTHQGKIKRMRREEF